MSLKRKISASALEESPNKTLRFTQDDDQVMQDSDQQEALDVAIQTAMMENNLQPGTEAIRRPVHLDPKAAEKAERWDELVFIVFAKDNFEQDPSGPVGHSTTSGPLTNAQLRDAYCNKFNKEVGAEAAMKRYRNDKGKVYDTYPNHPRRITYAPKPNTSKRPRPKVSNESTNDEDYTERGSDYTDVAKATQGARDPQIAGIRPMSQKEREDIEAGDLREYVESSRAVSEDEHQQWVRIVLTDSSERFIGVCYVGAEDLKSSLAYVEYRHETDVQDLWLTGVASNTLKRYVQCISPVRLSQLPRCDFLLTPTGSDPVAAVASCETIVWNFEATLDIYELAAQLRDCHVRNLVLNHWRGQLRVNQTYVVGITEMQLLYDRLPTEDPALQFWAQALALLPMDDTNLDIDSVESPSLTTLFIEDKHMIENDEMFHYKYHRCYLSDHKDGMCDYFQHTQTEALYTFDHFAQIARRLLLSEGWQAMDPRISIAEEKLELELYNMFHSL